MSQSAVSIICRLHEHRAWANENLLAAAARLEDEQLRREFPIGQGSAWKSLVHMCAAEFVWLEVLWGNQDPCFPGDVRGKLPGNQLGEGGPSTLDELRELWTAQESRWREYLSRLDDAALDEQVVRDRSSVAGGGRFVIRRSDALLHVCLHAHYTLTQAVNMLRHLGVEELPERMMIQLAWSEGKMSNQT